jgi:hypothetical protein
MLKTQAIVVDTLHDMQRFLTDHATEVGPGIEVARGTLDTTVANIETHLVEQDAGVRNALGATQKLNALKAALRFDHMRAIAEIARRQLATVPEFKALKLPPTQLATTRLLVAAQSMGVAAAPYAATFTALGLAPDFLERLQAAVDELMQGVNTRQQHKAGHAGATAGLAASITEGHSIIKLMDSLVRPRIRANPVLLTTWLSTIRFRRTAKNAVPAVSSSPSGSGTTTSTVSTISTTSTPTPAAVAAAPVTATPAAPAASAPTAG